MPPMPTDLPPPPDDLNALPAGTRFGELEILQLLGTGGFGLVYLAKDHALERLVAVKEYMPGQLAQRGQNSQVSVRSGSMRETFELGLRSFVNEARLLARFDHRALIKVYRFWEANNTAYMVMPYLQGQTLKQWRDASPQAPSNEWLMKRLLPMLEALTELHNAQVYHRDIAPDNIFLPQDGSDPILLDFGAARRTIGDRTQSFTAILKPSYAPLEQYDGASALKQGPWTDLYALGAVLYHLLTGHPPPAATRRALNDEFQPLLEAQFPEHAGSLLGAINWALALRPGDRPQSVAVFRDAVLGRAELPMPLPAALASRPAQSLPPQPFEKTMAVGSGHAPTQLLTADQRVYTTEASGLLPSAPTPTIPLPASPEPAPSSKPVKAPVSTVAKRSVPWVPIGMGAAALLLLAFWGVLRSGGSTEEKPVAEAASAASALGSAPPASAASGISPTGAVVAQAAPALAVGETFVEPTPQKPALKPPQPVRLTEPRPAPAPAQRPSPVVNPAASPTVPPEVVAASAPSPEASELKAAAPSDPRAACGSRVFIAMAICIDRQCKKPSFEKHPECVRLREIREERQRDRGE